MTAVPPAKSIPGVTGMPVMMNVIMTITAATAKRDAGTAIIFFGLYLLMSYLNFFIRRYSIDVHRININSRGLVFIMNL